MKVVDCFSSTSAVTSGRRATERTKRAGIFFKREVPNLQKVGIDETATPLFWQQKFYDPPHHRYTLPPKQAKIVLKSVFLSKINTLWSFCDSLHFMTPLFFSFKKFMNPQYIWDPPSEENVSPLTFDAAVSKNH